MSTCSSKCNTCHRALPDQFSVLSTLQQLEIWFDTHPSIPFLDDVYTRRRRCFSIIILRFKHS